MSPSIALKVMRFFNSKESEKRDLNLSERELEVLKNLSKGDSYKMIADVLGISYFTVNSHIRKIYEKLQVHSMGEAISMVHKLKLFDTD
jgi:DNA-binding NarL/FixJ family response regulator